MEEARLLDDVPGPERADRSSRPLRISSRHTASRVAGEAADGSRSRDGNNNNRPAGAAQGGEPGLREPWETSEQQRLHAARVWLNTLAEKGPLRAGLDVDDAVDTLWLYMAPDLFHRLIHHRGWSQEHFQSGLTDTLRRLLLPDD